MRASHGSNDAPSALILLSRVTGRIQSPLCPGALKARPGSFVRRRSAIHRPMSFLLRFSLRSPRRLPLLLLTLFIPPTTARLLSLRWINIPRITRFPIRPRIRHATHRVVTLHGDEFTSPLYARFHRRFLSRRDRLAERPSSRFGARPAVRFTSAQGTLRSGSACNESRSPRTRCGRNFRSGNGRGGPPFHLLTGSRAPFGNGASEIRATPGGENARVEKYR